MDPIAHTLAGASLAQTGLKDKTPLATATLVIGANLPDIDGIANFLGSDRALYYRRGLTHGVLAQALLPLLLWACILAYDRWIRRARDPALPPVKAPLLLGLAYLGVLSHPLLDWLNTYGVRLLMPLSGRWFYGDTLFIIDAWMWLLMATAVVFAYSRSRLSQGLWLILGCATTTLIVAVDIVPQLTKVVWCCGIGLIVIARRRGISSRQNQGIAVACITAFCLYLALMFGGNQLVKVRVSDTINAIYGESIQEMMVGPMPGAPLQREVIIKGEKHYFGLSVSLLKSKEMTPLFDPIPLPSSDPVIERALQNQDIQGFVNWMRFPIYQIETFPHLGYRVTIRDLRYVRPHQTDTRGIGMAVTQIPL